MGIDLFKEIEKAAERECLECTHKGNVRTCDCLAGHILRLITDYDAEIRKINIDDFFDVKGSQISMFEDE